MPRVVLIICLIILIHPYQAAADTIHLKSGKNFVARILNEDDARVWAEVGPARLSISRATIDWIDIGINVAVVRQRVLNELLEASRLLESGRNEEARLFLEAALWRLDNELETVERPPQELVRLREKLLESFRQSLPTDADSQKAQTLFEDALVAMDQLDYRRAQPMLIEAARLAPNRADIQLRLGIIANYLNDVDAAIDAYKTVLELYPEPYYEFAARVLVQRLHESGAASMASSDFAAALKYFRDLLFYADQETLEPIPLEDFLAKRDTRKEQLELETQLRLFEFADARQSWEFAGLAAAALQRASELAPEDEHIRLLLREYRYILDMTGLLKRGDIRSASYLYADTPKDIRESERCVTRIDRYAGDRILQVRAQVILNRAMELFRSGDIEGAEREVRRLLAEFGATGQARNARDLLKRIESERHIYANLRTIDRLLGEWKFAEAAALLKKMLADPTVTSSDHRAVLRRRLADVEREQGAFELWLLAQKALESEDYELTLAELREVEERFRGTRVAASATAWLRQNESRVLRKSDIMKRMRDGYIAWASNVNFWGGRENTELDEAKRRAYEAFERVMHEDVLNWRRPRTMIDWFVNVILPGVVVLVCLTALMGRFLALGRAKFKPRVIKTEEIRQQEVIDAEEQRERNFCRMCGLPLKENPKLCPHCGITVQLSPVELLRREDEKRWADWNPWDPIEARNVVDKFPVLYQKALDHRHSHPRTALEFCQKAIRENPRRAAAWELLADLYEKTNERDKALNCYYEICMLEPDDKVARLKRESIDPPPNQEQPLRLSGLITVLSACLWWLAFWLVWSLFPQYLLVQIGVAAGGFLLTRTLMIYCQRYGVLMLDAGDPVAADVHHDIPAEVLNWRSQRRQARWLRAKLQEHLGVSVPNLSPSSIYRAVFLSLTLFATMAAIAWFMEFPWVFLGWPAGVVLFFYLMVVHPRALTAHLILRHLWEEIGVPWADFHKRFRPRHDKALAGEFLIRNNLEFPLRWAWNPMPYRKHQQGFLNALQQFYNRHVALHRYYINLRVTRHYSFATPVGFSAILFFTNCLLLGSVGYTGWLYYTDIENRLAYEQAMRQGYDLILRKQTNEAMEQFRLAEARYARRPAPHLYMGHVFASRKMMDDAEAEFRRAVQFARLGTTVKADFANFLISRGRAEEALPLLEEVLAVAPDDADLCNNLAAALFELGQYDRAEQMLAKAVALDPDHETAMVTLGLVYEKLGKRQEARETYERAISTRGDTRYAELARLRLDADLDEGDMQDLKLEPMFGVVAGA